MKAALQASFRLLKAICRGNPVVQGRLFDQLDFLLRVKGAEPEMAEAILEVIIWETFHPVVFMFLQRTA